MARRAGSLPPATAKRLLQDLQEVLRYPVCGAAALPLDDLTVWHANLCSPSETFKVLGLDGSDGTYENVLVHLVLVFNDDYPAFAPRMRLFHALPHPNATRSLPAPRGAEGSAWEFAMWDCMPGEDAWSSAYTVHSILLQLQAFLLDPKLLFATHQVTHQQAAHEAPQPAPRPIIPGAEEEARTPATPAARRNAARSLQRAKRRSANAAAAGLDGSTGSSAVPTIPSPNPANPGGWDAAVLRKEFPGAQLTASTAADWKHAYLMQAGNVAGDLHCFFTRAGFQEATLGMPLRFTVNPRLKAVDQIEASPDLVSLEAFHIGLVTKDLDHQAAQAVLPMYITAEHFERVKAGKSLQQALKKLMPGSGSLSPAAWVETMPKLLNTAVLLLMDKGVAASDRALTSYCMLHRLSLALVEDFKLLPAVLTRLDRFQKAPASRVKAQTPNLGWLIALLSLTPATRHSWRSLGTLVMEEQLDRQILWICQQNPQLQDALDRPPDAEPRADVNLVAESFEACKLGLRLVAFHVAFLKLIARPAGTSFVQVMESYDMLYGRPPLALQRRMRDVTQRILDISDWAAFFRMIGFPMPPQETSQRMTGLLRRAWKRSLQKGYHKKGMDFSKIQARGVSRLLLRGEKFSAPPNMKRISIFDRWRWQGHHVEYLDASCLLFAQDGRFIEAVDWDDLRSRGTKMAGAVSHSGDQMDDVAQQGTHEINIKLDDLGAHVTQLVIVVSAYAGAMLSRIQQPFVSIQDPATKAILCKMLRPPRETDTPGSDCGFSPALIGWRQPFIGPMDPSHFSQPSHESTPETTGRVQLAQHSMYYELRGLRHKQKVILLNPLACTAKFYGGLADALASQHQVLTYDYRGIGHSTCPRGRNWTSQLMAADALGLLDGVWPEQVVHVAGISMGGFIAQKLAVPLMQQGRLASLCLLVASASYLPKLHMPLFMYDLASSFIFGGPPRKLLEKSRPSQNLFLKLFAPGVEKRPATAPDGSESTMGKLWVDKWLSEVDEWFAINDH
ncbi:hypothetical protein WJX84_008701, partial [Apatococcus fuscideae]